MSRGKPPGYATKFTIPFEPLATLLVRRPVPRLHNAFARKVRYVPPEQADQQITDVWLMSSSLMALLLVARQKKTATFVRDA